MGGKPLARSGKDGGKTHDWSAVSRLGGLGRRAGRQVGHGPRRGRTAGVWQQRD